MKHIKYFGYLLLAASLTVGCSEAEIPDFPDTLQPVLKTTTGTPELKLSVESNTLTKATFTVEVTNGGDDIKTIGFVYSSTNTEPERDDDDVKLLLSLATSLKHSQSVNGLETGTTYYIRAFVTLADQSIYYSEVMEYTPTPISASIETMKIFNRVKRAAIVCGRFIESGNNLRSYGVVLSKDACPTLENGTYIAATDTATDNNYRGIFGVFFDDLEENTMYHVRAYAVTQTDTVYGNERIFKTTQGGSFNWTFTNPQSAQDAGAYTRIVTHVDSAMWYYRNYTNLNKFLWVNYSPGTPTADCNIEGWMNVGANSRYQWVGTIQHEMCHALGVGTASNWMSFGSPWDKQEAVLTLRVMMKDMSMNISHDGMHFWPGGINQQEEVTNGTQNEKKTYTLKQALMLKANALIINAMRNDGLTSY